MTREPSPKLASLDALRGLAALAVVFHHVRVDLWVGWREIWGHAGMYSVWDKGLSLLALPAPFLGSGVMLFFVISGFCIHLPPGGESHAGSFMVLIRMAAGAPNTPSLLGRGDRDLDV